MLIPEDKDTFESWRPGSIPTDGHGDGNSNMRYIVLESVSVLEEQAGFEVAEGAELEVVE